MMTFNQWVRWRNQQNPPYQTNQSPPSPSIATESL